MKRVFDHFFSVFSSIMNFFAGSEFYGYLFFHVSRFFAAGILSVAIILRSWVYITNKHCRSLILLRLVPARGGYCRESRKTVQKPHERNNSPGYCGSCHRNDLHLKKKLSAGLLSDCNASWYIISF